MNELLSRLFSLRRLSPTDPGVRFDLLIDPPAWAWALLVLGAAAAAGWSYRRLDGPAWARAGLASLRAALVLALALLACGPRLVQQDQRIEKDWVVALVDRSASLTVADAEGPAGPETRDEQLRRALAGSAGVWNALHAERNLLWLGFDAGAFDLPAPAGDAAAGLPELGPPAGRSTDLAQALDQALRRVAARPVAGVVVFSDGRSGRPVDRGTLKRLAAERIPVFVAPLGSPRRRADLAVADVEAPTSAFTGDTVPVSVTVRTTGRDAGPAMVALLDAEGNVLDERPVPPAPEGADADADEGVPARVTLTARPAAPGATRWTVRVRGAGPDVSPENDSAVLPIELVDRPVRVVYFDGSPRWEYRYLKNLLLREPTIRSTALLLAPERRYLQEGSEPLASIPRTAADWSAFDVVILGDVRPELFSAEQLEALREVVLRRGVGLLWVGGPQSTPGRWAGTPLADLLPFSMGAVEGTQGGARGVSVWTVPVLMRRTQAAERLALLQMGGSAGEPWPEALADPTVGWSPLRWAQRIDPTIVKPTAEVLATALSAVSGDDAGQAAEAPIVLTMRYGAGRSVYVGTDEVWRWRFGRGETLPERFYLPLIRLLARESLGRLGKPVLIEASPSPAVVDRPVRVVVTLLDESLLVSNPASLTVRFSRRDAADEGAEPAPTFDLSLARVGGGSSASRPGAPAGNPGAAARFEGTIVPSEPGRFIIRPLDAFLIEALAAMPDQPVPQAALDVLPPDDELRFSRTDHAALAELAQATGGRTLTLDASADGASPSLGDLPRLLPNRELRLLGAQREESLWDKPFTLALLLTLLTLEWVGRRLIRLV